MFGKKKQIIEENEWTQKYKQLWNNVNTITYAIRKQVYEVEATLQVLNLYPDCPEKEEAIQRKEEAQQKLADLLSKHRKAIIEVEKYWTLHLWDIEVNWQPNQLPSGTKIIEDYYRSIHNLWMRA